MKIGESANSSSIPLNFTNNNEKNLPNNKIFQNNSNIFGLLKMDYSFSKGKVGFMMLIILIYFFFKESQHSDELKAKRNLLTHQEYLNLCYNTETNTILGFDITKLNTYNIAFNDYISSLNNYDKNNEIYIEQAVSGNFNSIWQLAKKLLIPHMVVAAFAGVTFISWFVFCGCHFRKSFCCKSDEVIEPKRGCKLVSLIIFTFALTIITLFSFLGIIFSFNLLKKMDEFECLLLQFYSDAKHGQLNNEYPRWIGYDKIPSFIYDLQNNYISIENEYKSIFRNADWVTKEREKLINELESIWDRFRNERKTNPDAESLERVIIPDIIEVRKFIYIAFGKI